MSEKAKPTERKQKISVSYTVKAFAQNIERLNEAKMITPEEMEILTNVKKEIIHRWISLEMRI